MGLSNTNSSSSTPVGSTPLVSVVVPTYRRPDAVVKCLAALRAQTYPKLEAIAVCRDTDEETRRALEGAAAEGGLQMRVATVSEPGVIAAMSIGVEAARGDYIALTDDDTRPYPDWIERIVAHFAADSQAAGVGGLDIQPQEKAGRRVVGKVSWFGYTVGNHHLGVGKARYVDLLKGANCAYRADLLRGVGFDRRLKGSGAQVHWELALCLALRRAGWKLIYDPAVTVDHFPGQRFDSDNYYRGGSEFNQEAHANAVHNETLILLEHLRPAGRATFAVWSAVMGSRGSPGVLQLARLLQMRDPGARQRWRATRAGRAAGAQAYSASVKPGAR